VADGSALVFGAFLENRFVTVVHQRDQPESRSLLLIAPTGAVSVAVRARVGLSWSTMEWTVHIFAALCVVG